MKFIAILLAALASVPVAAQETADPVQLSLEQQTSLRCAAAFALVASQQQAGLAEALSLPPLQERGREFFVRYSAQLMDETGMNRAQVAGLLTSEAQKLLAEDNVEQIMPACLMLLDASGL